MKEKLNTALEQISDRHIDDAAKKQKPRRAFWFSAAAAVLAAAILISALTGPMAIRAEALTEASASRVTPRPDRNDYKELADWDAAMDVYEAENARRLEIKRTALDGLKSFFTQGSALFLSGSEENRLWSPANAAIGLGALTELTGGDTRQQLLDALGADTGSLRAQISALWESAYADGQNGREASRLATSLWLEDGLSCNQETLDALSCHHYASVYRGDLGSSKINSAIGAWLNNNTGGLLKENADSIRLPEDTVLALYATLYFQSKWSSEFNAANNTDGVFHAPGEEITATYMNKQLAMMNYYWGETFGAVSLSLKNGSQMWFILPDEGSSIDAVLESGEYLDLLLPGKWENTKYMKVNLSVPKFDITGTQNLRNGLMEMGITDVFSETDSDFSGITSQIPVYLTAANQAVRVQIDETGVKAAAYIELPGAMSPAPPDEIIDFVLDRPFLFFITRNNVPLFAGAVNRPQ